MDTSAFASFRSILLALIVGLYAAPASAAGNSSLDQDAFVFGGQLTDEYFEYNFVPFMPAYDDNHILGVGYQKFLYEPLDDLKIGVEAGVATRFGDAFTGEVWGGVVARYDGFIINNNWRLSPALTFGLSAVSGAIGTEIIREKRRNGDAHLLFYLGPEISLGKTDSNDEFFFRLQHRSGAWGTLGNLHDGANAQVIGFRHKF